MNRLLAPGLCFCLLLSWLPRAEATEYLVGQVEAAQRVVVSAETDGVVTGYSARLGDSVDTGQDLVSLDEQDAMLNVSLARARLALSEAELKSQRRQLNRLKALAKQQTLAESELDDQLRITKVSGAQVQVDNQLLAQAQRQLEKTSITAPFTAIVAKRHVEAGQWVNQGDPLYELVALDPIVVRFVLIEQDMTPYVVGQAVEVYFPALNKTVNTRVERVSPALSTDGHGYPAELELANPDHQIKPGYRAEIRSVGDEQ